MQLTINGESKEYGATMTVGKLLETLGLRDQYVAVECNLEVISYAKYDEVMLVDGDRLEIVTLVGGG